MRRSLLLALWLLSLGIIDQTLASAIEPLPFRSDIEEIRFKALAGEIRCTVCQNQSLADSDVPLAQDLRRELFFMIQDGRSDQEIRNFMVERYGDFVLYRPPLASHTLLLWAGPIVLLLIGLLGSVVIIRQRRALL